MQQQKWAVQNFRLKSHTQSWNLFSNTALSHKQENMEIALFKPQESFSIFLD